MTKPEDFDSLIQRLKDTQQETLKAIREARIERRKALRTSKVIDIKANPMPPLNVLQESFKIDPESPSGLTRIKSTRGPSGAKGPAIAKCSAGLWRVKLSGCNYRTARVIYYMHTGTDPLNLVVIHKDDNPMNNHRDNLKAIPSQERYGN